MPDLFKANTGAWCQDAIVHSGRRRRNSAIAARRPRRNRRCGAPIVGKSRTPPAQADKVASFFMGCLFKVIMGLRLFRKPEKLQRVGGRQRDLIISANDLRRG